MPFYEYQCGECGHRLEVLQKISDDPLIYCPECNEAALKKLISAAAFRLKGSGWYETDFKNNDKKKEKSSDKNSDQKTDNSKPEQSSQSDKKADTSKSDKPVTPVSTKGKDSSSTSAA